MVSRIRHNLFIFKGFNISKKIFINNSYLGNSIYKMRVLIITAKLSAFYQYYKYFTGITIIYHNSSQYI